MGGRRLFSMWRCCCGGGGNVPGDAFLDQEGHAFLDEDGNEFESE